MKKTLTKIILFIIGLWFYLFVAKAQQINNKVMIYGETSKLDAYDPYTVHETSAHRLSDMIFNSLITIKSNGEYEGELAQNWKILNGNTAIKINLRKNVYWHDSLFKNSKTNNKQIVTAKDIENTIRLLQSPVSEIPNKQRFEAINSVQVISDFEVIIRFKMAVNDPLRMLMFKILPHHLLNNVKGLTRNIKYVKKPIGTGPYVIKSITPQGEIILTANNKYFLGSPKIKTIIMKPYSDQIIMDQSLMFGALDLVTYVSPRNINEIKGDKNLLVIPYDNLTFTFLALNNSNKFLKNKKIRQAIAYAINRKEMLKAFFQNRGTLITGPFPPSSWAYNLDVQPYEYDTKKSIALLQSEGLIDKNKDKYLEAPDGSIVQLTFVVPLVGESEMIKRIVLAIQQYLEDIGIKIKLQFMDWLVWKEKVLGKHQYDITIASWNFDDAANISSLFHSSSAIAWGNNFVLYKNINVDSLLTESNATNDFEKKRKIYQKLHAILAADVPYVYLWTLYNHAAHNNKLYGVKIEPFAFFKYINFWDIKK